MKKITLFVVFIVVFSFLACSSSQNTPEAIMKNIISKMEQMVAVYESKTKMEEKTEKLKSIAKDFEKLNEKYSNIVDNLSDKEKVELVNKYGIKLAKLTKKIMPILMKIKAIKQ